MITQLGSLNTLAKKFAWADVQLCIKAEGTLISEAMGEPYIRSEKKIGRNDPCPCGLEKKYKHCCMKNKYSDVFILK